MGELISVLVTDEARVGHIITAHLDFRTRLDILCSLLLHIASDQPFRDYVENLRDRLDRANYQRNGLIHAEWGEGKRPGQNKKIRLTARAHTGFDRRIEYVSASQITKMRRTVEGLNGELLDLFERITPMLWRSTTANRSS